MTEKAGRTDCYGVGTNFTTGCSLAANTLASSLGVYLNSGMVTLSFQLIEKACCVDVHRSHRLPAYILLQTLICCLSSFRNPNN